MNPFSARFFTVIALLLPLGSWAESMPVQTVSMERHAAGTFYVDAALEGFGDLRLLVDTGSSYLVIGQDIVEELQRNGAATFLREIGGRMADNSRRVVPIYRIERLRLGETCWISDVEAAVFPSGIRPILGMRTLARLAPFTFSTAPAELGLSTCEGLQAVKLEGRQLTEPGVMPEAQEELATAAITSTPATSPVTDSAN